MKTRAHHLLAILLLPALPVNAAWSQQETELLPSSELQALDLSGQDRSVSAGDNFYRHANGGYLDRLKLPPDLASFSSAKMLSDTVDSNLRTVLEQTESSKGDPPGAALARDFYASFMDLERIESLGITPVQAHLHAIRQARSRGALAALMGQENSSFFASIFSLEITPDQRSPERYSVEIGQPELGLPDKSYYLDTSMAALRKQYLAYIQELLERGGWKGEADPAEHLLQFEQQIAQLSWSSERQRDPVAVYNPMRVSELEHVAPGFAWKQYLAAAGLAHEERVVLEEKSAVCAIAALFARTPLKTLQAWAAFALLDRAAPYLPSGFRDAAFQIHGKALEGRQQAPPRWKQGLRLVGSANAMTEIESNANLGDLVGQLYVGRYFTPAARRQAEELVASVKVALRTRIQSATWFDEATRAEALRKIDRYSIQVGFPEHWRQYAGLRMDRKDLAGNIQRAARFNWEFAVARLHQPVDRDEWPMEPQTINAYNEAVLRKIVFSAALLQPPVFDPRADAAVNYGGLGAIIGHELMHGFDDQGRRFDSKGHFRDWWDPGAARSFQSMADHLGAQFDACAVLPGVFVNGKLTMGENLADLGGLALALDAYHNSLHGREAPVIEGLTGDQRFFLAFAEVRRGKKTEQALRAQVLTDPHSPDECRVNIAVRNVDAWYTAFAVKPGQRLYLDPEHRVRLW